MDPALLALTLFPSANHREIGVGPYAFESDLAPLVIDGPPSTQGPVGLELMSRRVFGAEGDEPNLSTSGTGHTAMLRMYRAPDGQVQLDRLEIENVLFGLRVRPELGDAFDLGLLGGSWDRTWVVADSGRWQARLYSPLTATAVGMSKSDQGMSGLRYYAEAGAGGGAEVMGRVVGPVGLQGRVELDATARRRRERGDAGWGQLHHSTRQEVTVTGELGVTLLRKRQAWVVGAWGEHVTQWEPFDEAGRNGVDRQYFAAGARLSGRFYKEREQSVLPGGNPEVLDMELQDLLEAIQGQGEPQVDNGGKDIQKEPSEPVDDGVRKAWEPLQVHWSEVEILTRVAPEWPMETPADATCTVRFYIDPTGTPYQVEPEDCPQQLVEPTQDAAMDWRFGPVSEEGETLSATFTFTVDQQDTATGSQDDAP